MRFLKDEKGVVDNLGTNAPPAKRIVTCSQNAGAPKKQSANQAFRLT